MEQSFSMAATKEAFQILSSNLYSDPILAVIRELSCNANDSHKMAGVEKPFYLHVPLPEEPFFLIRDYGTGIPEDLIYNIYTSYFVSTKVDNENQTGCFGLGSKTPFAIVDEYTVTSYCDGKKISYLMKKVDGLPTVSKISEDPSSETGLEIKFNIPNPNYWRWRTDTEEFFKGTSFLPNINLFGEDFWRSSDGEDFIQDRTFFSNDNIEFFHAYKPSIYINVAGVSFGINIDDLKDKSEDVKKALESAGVGRINISCGKNDVSLTPSREVLHYDQKTTDFISGKIYQFVNEYFSKLRASIENIKYKEALNILSYNTFDSEVNIKIKDKIDKLFFDLSLKVVPITKGKSIDVYRASDNVFTSSYRKPENIYLVDTTGIKEETKKKVVQNFLEHITIDGRKCTSTSFTGVVKEFTDNDHPSLVLFVKGADLTKSVEFCPQGIIIKWADFCGLSKKKPSVKRGFKTRGSFSFVDTINNKKIGYTKSTDLEDDEVGLIFKGEDYSDLSSECRNKLSILQALEIPFKVCVRPCKDSVYDSYKKKGFKSLDEYVKERVLPKKDEIIQDIILNEKLKAVKVLLCDYSCTFNQKFYSLLNRSSYDVLENDDNFKRLRELYTFENFEKYRKSNYDNFAINGLLELFKDELSEVKDSYDKDLYEIKFDSFPLWGYLNTYNIAGDENLGGWEAFFDYAALYIAQKKTNESDLVA